MTRLADLTALDTIGLPVWSAYRPNGRSLSVCQGKGLTNEAAKLTALMEAAETASAEDCERLVSVWATTAEMKAAAREIVPLQNMMKCCLPNLDAGRKFGWVLGRALQSDRPVWAPYELVGLDMRYDAPWDRGVFKMSSVGLAAHRTWCDAILHGLLEAIEYDALALAFAWPGIFENLPIIEIEAAVNVEFDCAFEKVRAAFVQPEFIDITSDIGLPTVLCILAGSDRKAPFVGHACHPDPEAAMLAALLEAVQSRLTDISGARDDISWSDYETFAPQNKTTDNRPRQSFLDFKAKFPADQFVLQMPEKIASMREKLVLRGISDIFVFELSDPKSDIACVSVICSHLEVGTATDGYRIGQRARRRILQFGMGML